MEHTAKVTYPQLCFVVPTREQTEKQNSAYVRISNYHMLNNFTGHPPLILNMNTGDKSRNCFLFSTNGTATQKNITNITYVDFTKFKEKKSDMKVSSCSKFSKKSLKDMSCL